MARLQDLEGSKAFQIIWDLTTVWRFIVWPIIDMVASLAMLFLFYKIAKKIHQEKNKEKSANENFQIAFKGSRFVNGNDDLDTEGMKSFLNRLATVVD